MSTPSRAMSARRSPTSSSMRRRGWRCANPARLGTIWYCATTVLVATRTTPATSFVLAANSPSSSSSEPDAPHEVLLVIDGNTGQNALAQVKAFDQALGLTGLVVTKLDGTAKGGVLAAIAQEKPVPVYFIGVGEKLEDLETFSAREFALALLA